MATTHQSVSITNSCFKQPIHPQTGLPTSKPERENDSLSNTWNADHTHHQTFNENGLSKSVNFDTDNSMADTMHQDLSGLGDDEFYHKLVTLKQEHKKTLELCEQLYNEKIDTRRYDTKTNPTNVSVSYDFSMAPQRSMGMPNTMTENHKEFEELRRSLLLSTKDRIKDMSSSKPPTGRPKTADPSLRTTSKEALNDSAVSGRSTVSGMWENFSLDEYIPHSTSRPRSASLSRLSSARSKSAKDAENEKKKKVQEWKHKITIPKPFHMSLREANKPPKQSKASIELEKQREEAARKEEAECQKRFKARPVPAHIYMPLYDEINEKEETRRRENTNRNKELLMSQEKPFKFMVREEEKKQQRRARPNSAHYLDGGEKKKPFKAKPFPERLFEGTVTDKLKEEEEYRKIRTEMRSRELLKTASLPPNMASRGQDYVDGKSRQKWYAEKARKAQLTEDHKFKPNTNKTMPNFEELHRQYMKEVAQRKAQREATVCKPFNLRTTSVDTKHKVYDDIERDEQVLKENRWPYQNPRAKPQRSSNLTRTLSTSMDAIPAQMTNSAHLRSSSNKSKLEKKIQSELDDLEAMRKRRIREQTLKQTIKQKAYANDQTVSLGQQRKQKLKEYRESEQARQEEYKSMLAEMKERVDKKPLLFERTAQDNARRAANRKYQATLAAAGVEEDFVERKGAASVASDVMRDFTDDEDVYTRQSSARSFQSGRRSASPQQMTASRKYTETFENDDSAADRTASEAELEAD